MSKRLLGIHFGLESFKLVELEWQKKNWQAVNWAITPFSPQASRAEQAKNIVAVLRENKISARQAIVSVSSPKLVQTLLDLPLMSEKEVAQAIFYKLQATLPFPVKDAVVSYARLTGLPARNNALYFVVALPKDQINSLIAVLRKSGIKVSEAVPFSLALNNLLKGETTTDRALIYLSKQSMLVVLVKNGTVAFAREVTVGGETIAQAMVGVIQTEQGKCEIDSARAEELKNTLGVPLEGDDYLKQAGIPASRVMAMMRPALEKIGAEILRTFEYYRNQTGDETEFKTIYFTGGVAMTKNLLPYFERELGLAVKPFPQGIEAAQKSFSEKYHSLSQAAGAALAEKPLLSLLPEEYKHPVISGLRKLMNYWFVSGVFCLILAISFSGASLAKQGLDRQAVALKQQLQTLGIGPGAIGQSMSQEQSLASSFNLPGVEDRIVTVIKQLDKVTPQNIYFSSMSYSRGDGKLLISGLVNKNPIEGGLMDLVKDLSNTKLFASVDLSNLRKVADQGSAYSFDLNCFLINGAGQ